MREICASGYVRGGGGNVPTYSAVDEGCPCAAVRRGRAFVGDVAVALQQTCVAGQRCLRMLGAAAWGIVEHLMSGKPIQRAKLEVACQVRDCDGASSLTALKASAWQCGRRQ